MYTVYEVDLSGLSSDVFDSEDFESAKSFYKNAKASKGSGGYQYYMINEDNIDVTWDGLTEEQRKQL